MYKRAERSAVYFSRLFVLYKLCCVHVSVILKQLWSDGKTYIKNIKICIFISQNFLHFLLKNTRIIFGNSFRRSFAFWWQITVSFYFFRCLVSKTFQYVLSDPLSHAELYSMFSYKSNASYILESLTIVCLSFAFIFMPCKGYLFMPGLWHLHINLLYFTPSTHCWPYHF